MLFKLEKFSGIAPALSARLLNDQFAQIAQNVDFESGTVTPIAVDLDVFTLYNGARQSIFYYNDSNWLEWSAARVSAVKGPIPNDAFNRLYWTGDADYPRMGTSTTILSGSTGYPGASYRLGVPAPSNAPAVSQSGTPDATETANTVSYVYTYVTAYGEEGPPSPASALLDITSSETVTVPMPSADHPAGNYNFGTGALKRIYRSNTGSTTTDYQFVAEVSFATVSYNDTIPSAELGEVLPSGAWVGPPDDDSALYPDGPLQGLVMVANGVMAGFTGNRLCLSEPYLPHAWPVEYRKTLEYDIVGIAPTSTGVVCMTKGTPYFVTGVDPSSMAAAKVPLLQPCINAASIVDMGEYALYAGADGLCKVGSGAAEVTTQGVISPAQWLNSFKAATYKAYKHEDTYVAFWTDGVEYGGFVFDPRSAESAISTLTCSAEVRGGWTNPVDGKTYVIVGNKIQQFRGGATYRTAQWRSKKIVLPRPAGFSWLFVDAEDYPITAKVWCDEVLIAHYVLSLSGTTYTLTVTVPGSISAGAVGSRPLMRLPVAVGKVWEVEVSGTNVVNTVALAQSVEELAGIS